MSAIGDFISPPEDRCGPCMFQAYLVSIFNLASVLWTACIGHCLYRAVRHHDMDVQRFEIRYHIFAWGLPLILALIPSNGMYGYDNGACWILEKYAYMRFIQFYIPLIFVIIFNAMIYSQLIASLRVVLGSTENQETRERDMEAFWRMGLYPVVLVICWFFPIINRLHNFANPDGPVYELYMLHRVFASCQGLFNCLVYGMNRTVREKLPEVFCCRSSSADDDTDEGGGGIQMAQARAAASASDRDPESGSKPADAPEDSDGDRARGSAPASDAV
mmetsp:Transcript_20750/g.42073  ORF Transcript_20750/g.42073 Transcript_20750/m.42073 type:complete len:275 (+) Transcript_20750:3-827(+)